MSAARADRGHRLELIAVALLLLIGTALRMWRLDLGWFGVDQARDVQTGLDIALGHDWPLVGPTMRRVTSLGALYYYFWALPHLVSSDPLAAYRWAALLGVVALLVTWWLARRHFGPRAGLVTLTILATSPVAIIDGRIAWAPAALPCIAAVLLWLLMDVARDDGAPRRPALARFALLGAVMGLALQLHLTMAAWAAAAMLAVGWRRPGWRPTVAGALGFLCIGSPAIYAVMANAGHDAGLPTLASRAPLPNLATRLFASTAVAWRVPPAFWQWPDAAAAWPAIQRVAGVAVAVLAVLGLARLAFDAARGGRASRTVLIVVACQLGIVAVLPGEVWYYYLDAALPLWALAAGALFMTTAREVRRAPARASAWTAALVIAAALPVALASAVWLRSIAAHDFLVLDPLSLTLDGSGGRDASVRGRLVTVGVKRAVAAALAAEPAAFAERWRATHGPAFDDATSDNGFWLRRASAATDPAPAPITHAALWYRDDPAAPLGATAGFTLTEVGPFVLARYQPTILYDRCHDGQAPIVVPMRVVPHPRRYGDGTPPRSATLPERVECAVAAGRGAVRVVAAVSAGSVTLTAPNGAAGAAGRESTLCIRRGDDPAPFAIAIALPVGTAADLDLYERPDSTCSGE